MGKGGGKMLVIVAPLQELWVCFLVCKFSGSVFKNCIGFCSPCLVKALLRLGWHRVLLAQLFSLLGISSCQGMLQAQHSLAALNNWADEGTEHLLHQAGAGLCSCCCVADGKMFKLRDYVPLFLSSFLLVPCVMNLSNFNVWNAVLSWWMSVCFSLGITAKTF